MFRSLTPSWTPSLKRPLNHFAPVAACALGLFLCSQTAQAAQAAQADANLIATTDVVAKIEAPESEAETMLPAPQAKPEMGERRMKRMRHHKQRRQHRSDHGFAMAHAGQREQRHVMRLIGPALAIMVSEHALCRRHRHGSKARASVGGGEWRQERMQRRQNRRERMRALTLRVLQPTDEQQSLIDQIQSARERAVSDAKASCETFASRRGKRHGNRGGDAMSETMPGTMSDTMPKADSQMGASLEALVDLVNIRANFLSSVSGEIIDLSQSLTKEQRDALDLLPHRGGKHGRRSWSGGREDRRGKHGGMGMKRWGQKNHRSEQGREMRQRDGQQRRNGGSGSY